MHRNFSSFEKSNSEALWSSYNLVNDYVSKYYENKNLTFFTTGILAKHNKDLLKQIIQDGHEIASHYYHHNYLEYQSLNQIESELNSAIDAVVNACNLKPIGFRAPAFSIPANRNDIFSLIKKYFRYDSSYILKYQEILSKSYLNNCVFNDQNFTEFPIVSKSYLLNMAHLKSGGSFFRIFSKKIITNIMNNTHKNGFTPIVYLHPYDMLSDREFWVDLKYLNKGSLNVRIWNWIMQHKYLSLGNKSTISKLKYLSKHFQHQGILKNAL
ncbi:polysaccharide deacetylase family protein [Pelagibacteraceae bacterium]|nr:polysaccharide deacetylase family protein [Pelagibacteraceae bacterium]